MLTKACVLFLGMRDLETDNYVCAHRICRARAIVLYHGHESTVRVSDKLGSQDISDSPGMACPWWQCPDHPLVGKPAVPTTVGFLAVAECGVTQKELLVVSPTTELVLLDPALPNQSLAFGTEGGWAWACFPLKEWQIGRFLSCHTEPSQKREWEMSGNSYLKSPGPKEVITLPCLTYLYCPVQMSPWYWCSPSCNFSWMRVHMKNIFHRALVWKHLVF